MPLSPFVQDVTPGLTLRLSPCDGWFSTLNTGYPFSRILASLATAANVVISIWVSLVFCRSWVTHGFFPSLRWLLGLRISPYANIISETLRPAKSETSEIRSDNSIGFVGNVGKIGYNSSNFTTILDLWTSRKC